jgi:hypothetical protein
MSDGNADRKKYARLTIEFKELGIQWRGNGLIVWIVLFLRLSICGTGRSTAIPT